MKINVRPKSQLNIFFLRAHSCHLGQHFPPFFIVSGLHHKLYKRRLGLGGVRWDWAKITKQLSWTVPVGSEIPTKQSNFWASCSAHRLRTLKLLHPYTKLPVLPIVYCFSFAVMNAIDKLSRLKQQKKKSSADQKNKEKQKYLPQKNVSAQIIIIVK